MKKSLDEGKTWLEEEMLPAGIVGPAKGKPILIDGKTLLCPSTVAVGEPGDRFKATACWIDVTEDKGLHWRKIGPFELSHRKFGVIEPVLFHDKEGCLKMYCRDRANKMGEKGFIWEAISSDQGMHWSEFKSTKLPNPDSGFDIVELGEGKLMLVYNHSHTDRFPLHFSLSFDGGEHWSEPYILDEIGEFPAAIATADGLIHITYAAPSSLTDQRRIKHIAIDSETLFLRR